MKAISFRFDGHSIDKTSGILTFDFSILFEDGHRESFHERLMLDDGLLAALPSADPDAVRRVMDALHLALGMSYWKMHCAPTIECASPLSFEQAAWWNTAYTKGLGEFFYNNKIDFRGLVAFPSDASATAEASAIGAMEAAISTIGGGKDSVVAAKLLKEKGIPMSLFALSPTSLHRTMASMIGAPLHTISRELDPEMVRRSKAGEVLNGHVPITLVYTLCATLVAILTKARFVVLANEKSANVGNVGYLGEEINHQWSKSEEAERMLNGYIRTNIAADIEMYSILRPYTEFEVLQKFVEMPEYFHIFSSCNKNFRLEKPLPTREGHAYWCGSCPKCAFVFAGLAALLPRATVVDIFGKDLFEDEALIPLYRALLGREAFKPFECVGTIEETQQIFEQIKKRATFSDTPVMNMYAS